MVGGGTSAVQSEERLRIARQDLLLHGGQQVGVGHQPADFLLAQRIGNRSRAARGPRPSRRSGGAANADRTRRCRHRSGRCTTKAAGAVLAHDVAAPGVVDPAQQEGEAAAAMGEAELEAARNALEGAGQDQRQDAELVSAGMATSQAASSASCGRRSSCPRMHQHRMPSSAQCTRKFTSVSSSRSRGRHGCRSAHPGGRRRGREASRLQVQVRSGTRQRFQAVGRMGAVLQRQVVMRAAQSAAARAG